MTAGDGTSLDCVGVSGSAVVLIVSPVGEDVNVAVGEVNVAVGVCAKGTYGRALAERGVGVFVGCCKGVDGGVGV
jgi:hypothetical protein